jgi:adenylosuccinate synthase
MIGDEEFATKVGQNDNARVRPPGGEPSIVLLSGPVGAGKTRLADALVHEHGFMRVFTRDAILRRLPRTPRTRRDLQAAGERLDRETNGRWVADELRGLLDAHGELPDVVVDAVMIDKQVEAVRAVTRTPVVHVHLTAPKNVLEDRYVAKQSGIKEEKHYADLLRNPTEASVERLRVIADFAIDSSVTPLDAEVAEVLARARSAG